MAVSLQQVVVEFGAPPLIHNHVRFIISECKPILYTDVSDKFVVRGKVFKTIRSRADFLLHDRLGSCFGIAMHVLVLTMNTAFADALGVSGTWNPWTKVSSSSGKDFHSSISNSSLLYVPTLIALRQPFVRNNLHRRCKIMSRYIDRQRVHPNPRPMKVVLLSFGR